MMPTLTNIEIDLVERNFGVTLPGLYRKLLVGVGFGRVGTYCEIYNPADVRDLYEPFFDNPQQLFDPYFPFGCNNRTQDMWIINAATERAASIWHEMVPDDWSDEEWLEYDLWVERYLAEDAESTEERD
jgi:hypothetical protein